MHSLKSLETKSNEVIKQTRRVLSTHCLGGIAAALKLRLTKTVKKQELFIWKIQLNATIRLDSCKFATTQKR